MGGGNGAFLTTSCTPSLELAVLLTDITLGEGLIFPNFAFVACVDAFALRRATLVV